MFAAKGCTKFHEFFKEAYDGGLSEPFATRFKESSANGDREEMIKILMDIPCVKNMKVAESYRGKDDVKAAEIYCKIRGTIVENGEQESRISVLAETLFMASVTSRLFLEVLFDCAQSCYDSRAFASCLRYCECMLALPASFYDRTAESMNDFFERRKACVYLEGECSKMLKRSSSRVKGTSGTKRDSNPKTPAVDGKPNSLLQSSSDAVALEFDEKRGRRLVATRNIKAGTVLIVESPFACTTNKDALNTNCLHCHASLKTTDSVKIPCRSCRAVKSIGFRGIKCTRVIGLQVSNLFMSTYIVYRLEIIKRHRRISPKSCSVPRGTSCGGTFIFPDGHFKVSFCSERCRKEAWQAYHRYECLFLDAFYEDRLEDTQKQVSHLLLAYRMTIAGSLSPKRRTVAVDNDRDDKADDDEIPFLNDDHVRQYAAAAKENRKRLGRSEIYQPQDYRTVLALKTHCAALDRNVNLVRGIEAIFLTKCFTHVLGKMDVVCLEEAFLWLAVGMMHHLQAINCNAYEIVENVYNKETHVWEPREIGGAIYPSVSLVNHSCYPNIVRHSYLAGTVVVRTLRFIGKGSEILDCYGPHFLSELRLQRREHLGKKYRFLCECEACVGNWQFPLPETIAYKCRTCSEPVGSFSLNGNVDKDGRRASTNIAQRCRCNEKKLDRNKLYAQFRKSVDRRLNAISRMYEGQYAQALPQLIEHINFIEKFFVAPNSETIKTQQCIIQCYNRFGCTSQ